MSDYLTADQVKCLLKRKFAEFGNEEVAPFAYRFVVPVFRTKEQLIRWADRFMDGDPQIRRHGPMGSWDVSLIEDFSEVFSALRNPKMREFDEDLRLWNVARTTNMRGMFRGCRSFNQNLSSWDTSSVTNMRDMFTGCVRDGFDNRHS